MRETNSSARGPIKVEIVTPVYNRRDITLQCLRSLARIDTTGLEVHIIIVDDGCVDGTGEAIREQFPEVQVIRGDGTLSYTLGTNLAIEAALERNPDYVLAINDDSIFHEQFLQRLVKCAENNPRSVAGPLLLLWDEPHRVAQIGARWRTWYGGWQTPMEQSVWDVPQQPFDVSVIVGNCVLVPAKAIREVGVMLGKSFPWACGDVEWTPRMKRAGWRLLIEPKSLVWFQPNSQPKSPTSMSNRELLHALFLNHRNPYNLRSQFISRWRSAPSRPVALVAFGIYLVRLFLRGVGVDRKWPGWPDQPITS